MANQLIKEVLRECNSDLIANLSPDPLIEHLYTRGILTDFEREHIRTAARSRYGQVGELLDIIRRKDNVVLDVLIAYLKETDQQNFLIDSLETAKAKQKQLKVSDKFVAGSTDFPLSFTHAQKIASYLVGSDPVILDRWGSIKYDFLDKSLDLYDVERVQGGPQRMIMKTLELWISRRSEQATFDKCVEILTKHSANAADGLKAKKNEMQGSQN